MRLLNRFVPTWRQLPDSAVQAHKYKSALWSAAKCKFNAQKLLVPTPCALLFTVHKKQSVVAVGVWIRVRFDLKMEDQKEKMTITACDKGLWGRRDRGMDFLPQNAHINTEASWMQNCAETGTMLVLSSHVPTHTHIHRYYTYTHTHRLMHKYMQSKESDTLLHFLTTVFLTLTNINYMYVYAWLPRAFASIQI